jgi:hypothetical protein
MTTVRTTFQQRRELRKAPDNLGIPSLWLRWTSTYKRDVGHLQYLQQQKQAVHHWVRCQCTPRLMGELRHQHESKKPNRICGKLQHGYS